MPLATLQLRSEVLMGEKDMHQRLFISYCATNELIDLLNRTKQDNIALYFYPDSMTDSAHRILIGNETVY